MTKTSTDAQIVGSVSFINGDARQFTDSKEYLDCIREELPYRATSGFSFHTVTQDPAIRKAVDDIVHCPIVFILLRINGVLFIQ